MNWLFACARAMAVVATVAICAASAVAAEPPPTLLGTPQVLAGPQGGIPAPAGPAVARQRAVVVNFGLVDPRAATTPPELGVELFDGAMITLDRARIEVRAPGNYTWYGRVRGLARSDAVLTVVDGHIAGTIVVVDTEARTSAVYEVVSGAGGIVWLRLLDPAGFPPDHPPGNEGVAIPPPGSGAVGPLQLPQDAPIVAADAGDTVDLMVVYTNETAAAAGSGIAAQIQQAVDRANLAYANSGIAPRLRLVRYAQVSYSEAGLTFETLLDHLTSATDGAMDEVHAWRNTYAADIVSLFVENTGYCGLGWLNSTAAYGFTVVNRGCAGGNLSLAHEIGHNFGAHHDPFVANNPYYPYGHGYVDVADKWRTVMAYNDQCAPASCVRISYFSNPDVSYGSPPVPTGTAAKHDNARVHDERAIAVANFRQSVAVGAPSTTTAAATAVAATGATLNGVVSANGAITTVTFQYGPTTTYGSTVAAAQSPLPAGAANALVSAAVTGLACNTLHHFRVVGASSQGTTYGADLTFTTAACGGASVTTTTVASDANPSAAGSTITLSASVTGTGPTGTVALLDGGSPIVGCGNLALTGSGNTRVASCTTNVLTVGTHAIVANYSGDLGNAPSASAVLAQQVVTTLPLTGTVIVDPYGGMTVQGGTLVGSQLTLTSAAATIQLGPVAGAAGSYAQIDFQGLHLGPGNMLTIRSGAAGQVLVLRNVSATASAIGGTLQAQGGNGALPPELYVANPSGIAISGSGNVIARAGLSLDALHNINWLAGNGLTHAGIVDGGPYLALYGANIRGGGAFLGDAIGLHTFGSANNPVNGAYFLQNGLQLYPSSGNRIALTINGYGSGKQVFNLYANGDATAWMPSAWPVGVNRPINNAVIMPGGTRPPGVSEPLYGGGSMIVQATGSLKLIDGGTNDFVFPGAIVLKAGGDLDLNGVLIDQGWTTSGQSFQGVFFESPNIVSPAGLIRVYGNDLNWINFSTLPKQYARVFTLKRNADGSASFVASDAVAPHQNTYSVLQSTAAAGGCWVCLVNSQPVNVYGP